MFDSLLEDLPTYALSALAALIALTVHEYCHGRMAFALGDPTAKNLGRLSLNPAHHLDLFGTLCLIFFHFGWAKPVPIDPRYFKKPKRDFALTALAGPLSNFVLSVFSAFLYLFSFALLKNVAFPTEFSLNVALNFLKFFYLFHIINLGLAIFNLIPVPPLDGSRLLNVILPPKVYFGIMKYERTVYWILIGWLFVGNYLSDFLLRMTAVSASPVLTVLATVISLSKLLSYAVSAVSNGIFFLWELIPFLAL